MPFPSSISFINPPLSWSFPLNLSQPDVGPQSRSLLSLSSSTCQIQLIDQSIQCFMCHIHNVLRFNWKSVNWITCGRIDKWEKFVGGSFKEGVLDTGYLVVITIKISLSNKINRILLPCSKLYFKRINTVNDRVNFRLHSCKSCINLLHYRTDLLHCRTKILYCRI
jgi:hypothetical protein